MRKDSLKPFNVAEILDLIPHRYPFILLDKVVELIPGKSIRAVKNVTINEPFFRGHFPDKPIMPGVLILESAAQAIRHFGIKNVDRRRYLYWQRVVFLCWC